LAIFVFGCRSEEKSPTPDPAVDTSGATTPMLTDSVEQDPVVREFQRWSRSLQTALAESIAQVQAIPIGRERDSALLRLVRTWDRSDSADSLVSWVNRTPGGLAALYPADGDTSRRDRILWWLSRSGLIHDVIEGEFFVLPHVGARMDLLEDILTPSTRAYMGYRAGADRIPLTNQEGVEIPWDSVSARILALEAIHRTHQGTVAADQARRDALLLAGYLIGHDEFDPCFEESGEAHPARLKAWRRLAGEAFDSPIHEAMAEWVEALDAAGLRKNSDLESLRTRLETRLREFLPEE
jgi:hypothetical protein